MNEMAVSKLVVGSITDADYYNAAGEKLISQGVLITATHVAALHRRNIHELYTVDPQEGKVPAAAPGEMLATSMPRAADGEDILGMRPGSEGMAQLLQKNGLTVRVDAAIERLLPGDEPHGTAFGAVPAPPGERSERQRQSARAHYAVALREIETLFKTLSGTAAVDADAVNGIVDRLLKLLIDDRDLGLAVSATRPAEADYLPTHSLNVCILSMAVAAACGYDAKQLAEIGAAALLHDAGMLLVPAGIYLKPARLTPDDWFEVQKHPLLAIHLLDRVSGLPLTASIVAYQVHERENGKGYPRQRPGRFIHRYAKIVQCADIFESVSSPRRYRPEVPPYAAMETLVKMGRQGLVDGDTVKAFLNCASLFPVGSIVEMSDRSVGRVVAANGALFTRPVVSILVDPEGRRLDPAALCRIDLSAQPDLAIVRSHRSDLLKDIDSLLGF